MMTKKDNNKNSFSKDLVIAISGTGLWILLLVLFTISWFPIRLGFLIVPLFLYFSNLKRAAALNFVLNLIFLGLVVFLSLLGSPDDSEVLHEFETISDNFSNNIMETENSVSGQTSMNEYTMNHCNLTFNYSNNWVLTDNSESTYNFTFVHDKEDLLLGGYFGNSEFNSFSDYSAYMMQEGISNIRSDPNVYRIEGNYSIVNDIDYFWLEYAQNDYVVYEVVLIEKTSVCSLSFVMTDSYEDMKPYIEEVVGSLRK